MNVWHSDFRDGANLTSDEGWQKCLSVISTLFCRQQIFVQVTKLILKYYEFSHRPVGWNFRYNSSSVLQWYMKDRVLYIFLMDMFSLDVPCHIARLVLWSGYHSVNHKDCCLSVVLLADYFIYRHSPFLNPSSSLATYWKMDPEFLIDLFYSLLSCPAMNTTAERAVLWCLCPNITWKTQTLGRIIISRLSDCFWVSLWINVVNMKAGMTGVWVENICMNDNFYYLPISSKC